MGHDSVGVYRLGSPEVASLGLWRLEIFQRREPFSVANRAEVPPAQIQFWCRHTPRSIDVVALHLFTLLPSSETFELLVNAESWGSQRDELRSDVQARVSIPRVRDAFSVALAALSELASNQVGIVSCSPNIDIEG